jgi:hypothetical protein
MCLEKLSKLKEELLNERPVPWDNLPDIDLYMDQLISYMPRQQLISSRENKITSAMVNNYIKANLLERANGKKYSRNHLAELSIISFLKQIVSVKDAALVFNELSKDDIRKNYEKYLVDLDQALVSVSEQLPDSLEDIEIAEMVMHLSVVSYANKLTCLRLIDILQEKEDKKRQIKKPKGELLK